MATTITHAGGTILPTLIDGYSASSELNTVIHGILNRASPDVTFREASMRVGTFRCLFPEMNDALAAFAILRSPQQFTITDTETPAIDMAFVVGTPGGGGSISIDLDDETRDAWWLNVPFVEVAP